MMIRVKILLIVLLIKVCPLGSSNLDVLTTTAALEIY